MYQSQQSNHKQIPNIKIIEIMFSGHNAINKETIKRIFLGVGRGGGRWHAMQACGILVSQPGIQPVPACSGSSKSEPLNHQGSPKNHLKNKTNNKAKWILNGHFQDNNTGKLLNIISILYIRWHYYIKFLRVLTVLWLCRKMVYLVPGLAYLRVQYHVYNCTPR